MNPKPIAFRCHPKTHERLKKLRAELKRKTGRFHSYEAMINGLIDDRKRLAEAEGRIAALYGLVSLFKGVARFGDPERMTRMLDLHYVEMDADGDQAGMDHGMSFTPCRGDASPQTEIGGSHGPHPYGSFRLVQLSER